jgi:lysophospholipase L1-like esterase
LSTHPDTPTHVGISTEPPRTNAGTVRLACLGDSLTRAQLSADYVEPLIARFPSGRLRVERFGVNGDFAYNVLHRLDPVVTTSPDAITILVGTNDARASLPGYPVAKAMRRKHLPQRPSLAWFRECLTATVARLQADTDAAIALLSLPALGQVLDAPPMRAAGAFSTTIAEVAAHTGVTYVPLHERQRAVLTHPGVPAVPYRELTAAGYLGTLFQRRVLRRGLDEIAHRRGLVLTTDHIHQDGTGASIITDLIERWLREVCLRP